MIDIVAIIRSLSETCNTVVYQSKSPCSTRVCKRDSNWARSAIWPFEKRDISSAPVRDFTLWATGGRAMDLLLAGA
jgi:hypothetical protein